VPAPMAEGEIRRLETLRSFQVLNTASEQSFDDLARLATLMCDTPVAVIDFVDDQRVWFKAKMGLAIDETPRERSFSTHAILQSRLLIVSDAVSDPRFTQHPLVTQAGIRFFAGMPLIVANGQAVGTLAVMDRVPHFLTAEQLDSLQILARQAVRELERRNLSELHTAGYGMRRGSGPPPSDVVLLAEDNDTLRALLQRLLESAGFSVLSAATGTQALRLYQQSSSVISLIISDVGMPELNGLQLAQQVRASRPEMKFLFIASFADRFPEVRELVSNGQDILEKPFLPTVFLAAVEALLQRTPAISGSSAPLAPEQALFPLRGWDGGVSL
jgi:CheY-like chemotaxis protein